MSKRTKKYEVEFTRKRVIDCHTADDGFSTVCDGVVSVSPGMPETILVNARNKQIARIAAAEYANLAWQGVAPLSMVVELKYDILKGISSVREVTSE